MVEVLVSVPMFISVIVRVGVVSTVVRVGVRAAIGGGELILEVADWVGHDAVWGWAVCGNEGEGSDQIRRWEARPRRRVELFEARCKRAMRVAMRMMRMIRMRAKRRGEERRGRKTGLRRTRIVEEKGSTLDTTALRANHAVWTYRRRHSALAAWLPALPIPPVCNVPCMPHSIHRTFHLKCVCIARSESETEDRQAGSTDRIVQYRA